MKETAQEDIQSKKQNTSGRIARKPIIAFCFYTRCDRTGVDVIEQIAHAKIANKLVWTTIS